MQYVRILVAGLLLAAPVLAAGAGPATPQPAQPRFRDVLASAFLYPFLTDAEVDLYLTDTRARVQGGRPALFRYPGITGLMVDGKPVAAERVGPDLLRAALPAGTHEVAVLVGGATAPAVAVAGEDGGVRTLQELTEDAADLQPGNELVVADGIYADWQVEIAAEGTAGKPIIIRAQTPGGVTFHRNTRFRLKGKFLVLKGFRFEQCGPDRVVHLAGADDCRVTQCHFLSCGNPISTFGQIVQVDMGSDRCRVDHCYFAGSKSMSLAQRISAADGVGLENRFDHNLFRDVFRYWINGQENIQIGQNQRGVTGAAAPRCLVEGNLFDHAWGDGEIVSNKSSGNVIRYNLAAHCPRSAFTLRGGDGVRFEGNVIVGNDCGLRVMGRRHTIINNLILDQAKWGILFETGSLDGQNQVASEGSLVAHNTILGCGAGAVGADATTEARPHPPKGNAFRSNLLAGNEGVVFDTRCLPEATLQRNLVWATGSARPGDSGRDAVPGNPLLTGSGWETRPAPKSPAVDRALPTPEVTRDRWGARRPAGAGPDIGADEVGGRPALGEGIVLPPIPPRPLLAPELYRRELLYAQKPAQPLEGWQGATGAAVEGDAIRLADGSAELAAPLPESFVLQWEYHPAAFAAAASLAFGVDGKGGGYTLSWGGAASDGKPAGVIALAKGTDRRSVADGADYLLYYQSFRFQKWIDKTVDTREAPDPGLWYRFTLLKEGGRLILLLADARHYDAGYPVLIWEDRGALGGPVPGAGGLRIEQRGVGSWRALRLWSYGYTGDVPPPVPAGLRAEARGGGRVALGWEDGGGGSAYEVYRGAVPGFRPSGANRIASGVRGVSYDDFTVAPSTRYVYRVRALNALGAASGFAEVSVTTGAGGPFYRIVDARRAASITPPMLLGTDADTGRTFVGPSRGATLAVQEAPAEGGAELALDVPATGEYVLWGLVLTPNEASDSFYTALDEGRFAAWYTGVHPAWQWSRMTPSTRLTAGRHVLRLKHREPNARLAAVMVTDDTTYAP